MSTKTADDRLADLHQRIDQLEAKARSTGAGALKSMTYQLGVLRRQEESSQTAVREARDQSVAKVSERAHAVDDKIQHLGTGRRCRASSGGPRGVGSAVARAQGGGQRGPRETRTEIRRGVAEVRVAKADASCRTGLA